MAVRRKVRIKWFRVLVLAIISYGLYVCVNQYIQYAAISCETDAARSHLDQLQQVNKSMIEEKQKLSTPAYVEKLAREELGLVKPGEVPYVR